jgi:ribonuclease HI
LLDDDVVFLFARQPVDTAASILVLGTKKMMSDETWTAWTDGAAINNPGPAGLGFVLISEDGVRREGYQGLGETTNNIAELTAILRVAELTPSTKPLLIRTDSKYAVGVLSQNWKASKNVELIAKTKAALAVHPSVKFEWVKGHSTNLENNVADKLAEMAAASRVVMSAPKIEIVSTTASKFYGVVDPAVLEEQTALAKANAEPLLVTKLSIKK